MTKANLLAATCVLLMGSHVTAAPLGGQTPPDSVAHPIVTNCGVRLDPVGFFLARAGELGLSPEEIGSIQDVGTRLVEENRPLGERFWALAGKGVADDRRPILFELRANYRAALEEIRNLVGAERFAQAFREPVGAEAEAGEIPCLVRAIPAMVGMRPSPGA